MDTVPPTAGHPVRVAHHTDIPSPLVSPPPDAVYLAACPTRTARVPDMQLRALGIRALVVALVLQPGRRRNMYMYECSSRTSTFLLLAARLAERVVDGDHLRLSA